MKTSDFYIKPSANNINESMQKKFGEKLDLENYSDEQLDRTFQLIENKIAIYKTSKFNDTLESEEYHRLTFMRDTVKTAISERAVSKSQQQAAGAALAAKRGKGKAKGASKEMMKMSTKELEKFASTKHKGLPKKKNESVEIDERVMTRAAKGVMKYGKDGMKALAKAGKDGKSLDKVRDKYNKYDETAVYEALKGGQKKLDKNHNNKLDSEDFKMLRAGKKDKKPVKENMQTMFELAKDLAEKYVDAHRKGDHKKMAFYERALEECGATISHGPMGECMMSHPHQAGGKPMPVGLLSPSGIVRVKSPSKLMTTERSVAEAKKSKPDFLDFDKDRNKKEPMKKALKDKAKKPVKESVDMAIRRYLLEGEEGKAELVMAVKNMVDKFTGWSEDIAKMQAQSAMEMADDIRDEMGSDQAEAFTQAISPALDAAFQAVKAAREALNSQVGSMTGNAPAAMGSEPDMGAEMPDMGSEPEADIAAAGETPPGGREKRESIERTRRLARILAGQ